MTPPPPDTGSVVPDIKVSKRYFFLFLLVLTYALNFLDRQIIGILKDPIAAELGLSDTQLGLMGGIAFAALYSTLAIPAAWLADRFSRVWIITISLAVWSGFTALCGMANSFTQLFLARMGVGVGEAGGVAPAYSLISDYFPPKQRSRALAIFSFGIPLGSACGLLFGGLLAYHVDWRFSFIVIGLAGVVLAPIFRLLMKDPPRNLYEPKAADAAKPLGLVAAAKLVSTKPTFWLLSLAAGSASMVGYGLMYWMPTFLARSLNMDLESRSIFLAILVICAGILGMSTGGYLGDKLGQKSKRAYALLPAAAFLISVPLYLLGWTATTPLIAFVAFLIPQALGMVWLGPVMASVQHLGPSHSRAMVSALFLLINNLLGLALGTYYFGFMSDLLKPIYGADSIKYAFISGLGFYVLASLLFFLASFRIKKDWVD